MRGIGEGGAMAECYHGKLIYARIEMCRRTADKQRAKQVHVARPDRAELLAVIDELLDMEKLMHERIEAVEATRWWRLGRWMGIVDKGKGKEGGA